MDAETREMCFRAMYRLIGKYTWQKKIKDGSVSYLDI